MAGIALAGVDAAGGTQLGGGQSTWTVNGAAIVVLGDPVASHGDSPHRSASMVQASGWMSINGIPVCRQGDVASCGHPSSGQSTFDVE